MSIKGNDDSLMEILEDTSGVNWWLQSFHRFSMVSMQHPFCQLCTSSEQRHAALRRFHMTQRLLKILKGFRLLCPSLSLFVSRSCKWFSTMIPQHPKGGTLSKDHWHPKHQRHRLIDGANAWWPKFTSRIWDRIRWLLIYVDFYYSFSFSVKNQE